MSEADNKKKLLEVLRASNEAREQLLTEIRETISSHKKNNKKLRDLVAEDN